MKILLADDQPNVRSAMRLLLEQQAKSNRVDEVTNTRELLNNINKHCPDILFLDWELPGHIPSNLLTNLCILCPDLFIVAMDSKPQTRHIALQAGANEFIGKNDPPERLLTVIENFTASYNMKKENSK